MTERRLLGHRGACAERPENTMISFERAVEIGVDVIETDVHLTADGEVVISHDPDGLRAAGVAETIADTRLEEIRAWDVGWGYRTEEGRRPFADQGLGVPTLAEVLEAFPTTPLNVDLKADDARLVAATLDVLRAHDAESRVCLASFHGSRIRQVRQSGFSGETVLAKEEVIAVLLTPASWGKKLPFGGDRLQIPTRSGPIDLASERFIAKCHRLGYRVDYWTINDPREAEQLLARGADGIITDDPAAIAPIVDRDR